MGVVQAALSATVSRSQVAGRGVGPRVHGVEDRGCRGRTWDMEDWVIFMKMIKGYDYSIVIEQWLGIVNSQHAIIT